MVSSFGLHHDAEVARARFQDGFRFFQFALGWHYGFGAHYPGRSDIWEKFQKALPHMPAVNRAEGGIATPEGLREHLRTFEACGVDQVAFIQQGGRNQHEHICEALELFAGEVMDEFKARETDRVARKAEALAPFVEAAFKRKAWMAPLADCEIKPVIALGRQIAEQAARRDQVTPQPPERTPWRAAVEAGDALSKSEASEPTG